MELLTPFVSVAGALFAVWWAVGLAFGRYKRERLWERKLQALTDVIAALAALRRLNEMWLAEWQEGARPPQAAAAEERGRRFRESEWKMREVAAVARVLWPDGVSEILLRVEQSFDGADAMVDLGDFEGAAEH